jgi:regulatory protein
MPFITQISATKRRPHWRRIYLDDDFAFACHLNVVARFRLRVGMPLSDDQVVRIQHAQVRQECFDRAMQYLKLRLHSRAELMRKLARRQFDEALIDQVLDQLTQLGYVNDAEFARTRARSAAARKHHGRQRTQLELLKTGVDCDVADRALDEIYASSDCNAAARMLAEKQIPRLSKLAPVVARRRLLGMMQRRGFALETAAPIVEELLGAEDSE